MDLQESCGYAGWHLSVNQLLDVMGEFRGGGGILTPAAAQAMLDDGFGVDPLTGNSALPAALTTLAGNVYCKPGNWNDPNKQDEQSLAFLLPEDMELAVLVNCVKQTYLDNLTTQPVHL
jgi:hypothetical protein